VVALEATGARPGELANARVRDWHDDVGAVVYYKDDKRREDEFRHKTGDKKDRFIHFTGEALTIVRELVKGKKPGDLIFPNRKGVQYTPSMISKVVRLLAIRAGVPGLVPYTYRHTYATRWLTRGGNIHLLAAQLGNTPDTIWKHYSHLLGQHDAVRAEIDRVRDISALPPSA
jgi:integrase